MHRAAVCRSACMLRCNPEEVTNCTSKLMTLILRATRQSRQSRQSMSFDELMQEWVNTMAAYVKSLDSNHLLTVGEEGFYPSGDANPSGNQTYVVVTCSVHHACFMH